MTAPVPSAPISTSRLAHARALPRVPAGTGRAAGVGEGRGTRAGGDDPARPGAQAAAGAASTMRRQLRRSRAAEPAPRAKGRGAAAARSRSGGWGRGPSLGGRAGPERSGRCPVPSHTGRPLAGRLRHRWGASPTRWMSLWRHESSSCRKPRLSTEHCCRLHTLAIFCRPPGPASAAAPRTPSRVARGRARTRALAVAPSAGGGAGARPPSPLRGLGVARGGPLLLLASRRPRALAQRPTARQPRNGACAALALQQGHSCPGPSRGFWFLN